MDPEPALDELPKVHARALRLHRAGVDTAGIAAELGIDAEAVAPLLRVAEAKLTRLITPPTTTACNDPAGPDPPDAS